MRENGTICPFGVSSPVYSISFGDIYYLANLTIENGTICPFGVFPELYSVFSHQNWTSPL